MHRDSVYGLWTGVVIKSAILVFFASSVVKPRTKQDWHRLEAFSVFIIPLFTEKCSFPLTIYFLSGWCAWCRPPQYVAFKLPSCSAFSSWYLTNSAMCIAVVWHRRQRGCRDC